MGRLAWGAAAAASYLLAAWLFNGVGGAPVRLLFDGPHPVQPYNYVDPPSADLARTNLPPQPGEFAFSLLSPGVIEGGSVTTGDGQATLTIPGSAFPVPPGQKGVVVRLTPIDPVTLGPPPEGLDFDGNAYTVEAEYRPSGDAATLERDVTAVLRYPVRAEVLLQWDGSRWNRLKSTTVPATLQVFADTGELGTLVAARSPLPSGPGFNYLVILPFAAIGLAALAGLRARLRQRKVWTRQGTRLRRPQGR